MLVINSEYSVMIDKRGTKDSPGGQEMEKRIIAWVLLLFMLTLSGCGMGRIQGRRKPGQR
jgi:hypothetical protein